MLWVNLFIEFKQKNWLRNFDCQHKIITNINKYYFINRIKTIDKIKKNVYFFTKCIFAWIINILLTRIMLFNFDIEHWISKWTLKILFIYLFEKISNIYK